MYVEPPVEWEVADYGDVDEQIKDEKILHDMPQKDFNIHVEQMKVLLQHIHTPARGVDNGHEFVRCTKCGEDMDNAK